jgi:hypothetical protein
MESKTKQRLQSLLTFADTIHDFSDMERYPPGDFTDTSDKRKELKRSIISSLTEEIIGAIIAEVREINSQLKTEQTEALLDLYKSSFTEKKIRKCLEDEDEICKVFKTMFAAIGFDYLNEGEFYRKFVFDREEMYAEYLYDTLSNMSGSMFIKYVLDKNQTDNYLFCVDPNILTNTTDNTSIDRRTRNFIFKSRYKGLFDDFDFHRNKVANSKNNSTVPTMTTPHQCCHKDHVEYIIHKDDKEMIELKELGVKNLPPYTIVYSHGDNVDTPISFQKNMSNTSNTTNKQKDSKGLTLFTQAIIDMKRFDMQNDDSTGLDLIALQTAALRTIDRLFSLRCDRFTTMYEPSSVQTPVYLSSIEFHHALYDLKRGMDYLPVKATRNANQEFSQNNMMYFYVSSDRLAIAYALLQGCPCIHVEHGGNIFHIYNYRGQMNTGMSGGQATTETTTMNYPTEQPSPVSERNGEETENLYGYQQLRLDHLIPDASKEPFTEFESFLLSYKAVFKERFMTNFWYIVYRFLFFGAEYPS